MCCESTLSTRVVVAKTDKGLALRENLRTKYSAKATRVKLPLKGSLNNINKTKKASIKILKNTGPH